MLIRFSSRSLGTARPIPFAIRTMTACMCGAMHLTMAAPLPQGGHFVAGQGQITNACAGLDISQSTARGIIDWKSFSIGRDRTVFINNGSGATLNRVTGSQLSLIAGQLKATGSVYLINPQGIVVGPHGTITTGGRFVASTLDTSNSAFMSAGNLTFTGTTTARADRDAGPLQNGIVNLGTISATGGDVFLISRNLIVNAGKISAAKGTAEMDVGSDVLLKDSSTGEQVFVDAGSRGKIVNHGMVKAAQISLQAADGNIYALAGKQSALRATGIGKRNGAVWLVAGDGTIDQHGAISARDANGTGGTVESTARSLDIAGSRVQAAQWNVKTAQFNIGSLTAKTLANALNAGTSVSVTTTGARVPSGSDIAVQASLQWNGNAALALNAHRSIVVSPNVTLANRGAGDLTLRADASGIDNGGSVVNHGTIDWSHSTGLVSMLYDMNGTYAPGAVSSNPSWSASAFSGLETQITSYRLVNTISDLNRVGQNLGGTYALGKDILIDPSVNNDFVPIGGATLQPFTGQFDGMGHRIDSLTMYLDDPAAMSGGLFYGIGATGVVRHLGITNATISAGASPFPGTMGALTGMNAGLVTYVYSTGSVIGYADFSGGPYNGGGLVGVNDGTIERSWSGASVGVPGYSGGLVGINNGLIQQSYSTGNVSNGVEGSVAGFVGYNAGTILQSYTTATSQDYWAGGLTYSNSGTISESYAGGPVQGYILHGAIALYNNGTIAPNVFWNIAATGTTDATYSGTSSAVGLTAAQMAQAASFGPTWDFSATGVWALPAGATQPILRWQLVQ